jgi:hypothetical protein
VTRHGELALTCNGKNWFNQRLTVFAVGVRGRFLDCNTRFERSSKMKKSVKKSSAKPSLKKKAAKRSTKKAGAKKSKKARK